MKIALILKLLSPLDRISQIWYMRSAIFFLKRMGVKIVGKPLWISPRIFWDLSVGGKITIGDGAVISHYVRVLTHDFSLDRVSETKYGKSKNELVRVAPVAIGDRAFIGLGAVLLPGANIGAGSIVGAGAVVSGDVPENVVISGNPARILSTTDEFWERSRHKYTSQPRRR